MLECILFGRSRSAGRDLLCINRLARGTADSWIPLPPSVDRLSVSMCRAPVLAEYQWCSGWHLGTFERLPSPSFRSAHVLAAGDSSRVRSAYVCACGSPRQLRVRSPMVSISINDGKNGSKHLGKILQIGLSEKLTSSSTQSWKFYSVCTIIYLLTNVKVKLKQHHYFVLNLQDFDKTFVFSLYKILSIAQHMSQELICLKWAWSFPE